MTYYPPKTLLSPSFTLGEFEYSYTATTKHIPNRIYTTDCHLFANLKALCENVLQPVRDMYGEPVRISSGYRCPTLNRLIGGAPQSQHIFGEAADFLISNVSTLDAATAIAMTDLPFDQLIYETRKRDGNLTEWIHVSHKRVASNRREVLSIHVIDGERTVHTGIVPPKQNEGIET